MTLRIILLCWLILTYVPWCFFIFLTIRYRTNFFSLLREVYIGDGKKTFKRFILVTLVLHSPLMVLALIGGIEALFSKQKSKKVEV